MISENEPLQIGDAFVIGTGPHVGRAGIVVGLTETVLGVTAWASLLQTKKHQRIDDVCVSRDEVAIFGRNTASPKLLCDPERLDDVRAWIAGDAILEGADG